MADDPWWQRSIPNSRLVFTDLGLAEHGLGHGGAGTRHKKAPEQADGRSYGRKVDTWVLGGVLVDCA